MRTGIWTARVGAAVMLTAAPSILPAVAQTRRQQADWCINDGEAFSPGQRIRGCTAMIQSGTLPGGLLAKTYFSRSIGYQDKKDFDLAIADLTEAIRLDKKYALAYFNRGVAWQAKGDLDRAMADYTEAIRINPGDAAAYLNRGSANDDKGEHDRAIADFNRAIELNPKYAKAYNDRGISYRSKGETDRAIADHTRAIELNPAYANAYYNRGVAYKDKGEYGLAIADFTRAIALDPDSACYFCRGTAYLKQGDYHRAIADYNRAIELAPNDASSYFNRGGAWKAKGDLDRAIADYTQAIRINPNDQAAYLLRGLAWHIKGNFDRAIADYSAAIAKDPKDAASLYGRGVAKLKKGDRAGSEADIAAAKTIQADIAGEFAADGISLDGNIPATVNEPAQPASGSAPGAPAGNTQPGPAFRHLSRTQVAALFGRFDLVLNRVRSDFVERPDENKLMLGAIQGMRTEFPSASQVSATGTVAAGEVSRADLEAVHNTALNILDSRPSSMDDARVVDAAINGMVSALDPHSAYLDPANYQEAMAQSRASFGGVGLELAAEGGLIRVVTPLDGAPAARVGVRAGDIITQVDGMPVNGSSLDQAVQKMRGQAGTKVMLTISRKAGAKQLEISIVREIIHNDSVRVHIELGGIGYLRITQFNEEVSRKVNAAIATLSKSTRLKGLIIDVRNNPGGLADQAISVADDFLDQGEIVSWRGRRDQNRRVAKRGDLVKGIPIIVLINGGTASAAEILAGALQDNKRAVVVGTRSFGKGTLQTVFPLGDGKGALRLTTIRFYTPSGHSIQATGITPDVEVHQDLQDDLKPKSNIRGEASLPGHLKAQGEELSDYESYIPAAPNDDKALQRAIEMLQ